MRESGHPWDEAFQRPSWGRKGSWQAKLLLVRRIELPSLQNHPCSADVVFFCSVTAKRSKLFLCLLSRVRLFVMSWTVACQASLFMGFPRQKYWSGLPSSAPEDLPDPGIEAESPALQVDYLPAEPLGKSLAPIFTPKIQHNQCGREPWSKQEFIFLQRRVTKRLAEFPTPQSVPPLRLSPSSKG